MIYTQKELEAITDHEVNMAMTAITQGCEKWCVSASNMSFYHCGIDGGGFYEIEVIDYCGNPSNVITFAFERKIWLTYNNETPTASKWHNNSMIHCNNKNQLRALATVWILVSQESDNA